MSDGHSRGSDKILGQATDPRVDALATDLIDASGQYGLRAEKLEKADTLLGLSAVRAWADRDTLTLPEAAVRVVRQAVDAWPDDRGRAILRSAFGFEHGTERGRPKRLDLLAAKLNEARTRRDRLNGESLDSAFTSRLAPDLAAELLADERRTPRARIPLVLGWAVALVLLLGLAAFLVLRDDNKTEEPTSELVFRPVPQRCSVDVCRDESRAVEAQTGGFTPGGVVDVEILAPTGEDANDLGGVYAYTNELVVNIEGGFDWRYWWDPGMEIGTYLVRITDQASGQSVEADFEFFEVDER